MDENQKRLGCLIQDMEILIDIINDACNKYCLAKMVNMDYPRGVNIVAADMYLKANHEGVGYHSAIINTDVTSAKPIDRKFLESLIEAMDETAKVIQEHLDRTMGGIDRYSNRAYMIKEEGIRVIEKIRKRMDYVDTEWTRSEENSDGNQ